MHARFRLVPKLMTAEKPHDAVVNFDTYRNLQRHTRIQAIKQAHVIIDLLTNYTVGHKNVPLLFLR